MGAALLAAIPAQFRDAIAPFVDAMVQGIHGAFSLAVGQTFWLGVLGSIAALIAAVAINELPLRTSNTMPGQPAAAGAGGPKPSDVPVAAQARQAD